MKCFDIFLFILFFFVISVTKITVLDVLTVFGFSTYTFGNWLLIFENEAW